MNMRWYVYRVHIGSELVYIGKGTGIRYLVSARRIGGIAGIVETFQRERAALKREKELIAIHSPRLNKTAGGEGRSFIKRPNEALIEQKWVQEAYQRAAHPHSTWIDKLIAIAFARCELNDLKRAVNV